VLLLADSTSRWAQAMRELSGPAGRDSRRGGVPGLPGEPHRGVLRAGRRLELRDGRVGSLTIGGTVSPAGGNFEEPVTQGTLEGGRRVPRAVERRAATPAATRPSTRSSRGASTTESSIRSRRFGACGKLLRHGNEVRQMMTVVGEEGTSIEDFTISLKADFFDNCYLQQNAFDEVDAATPADRQKFVFSKVAEVIDADLGFRTSRRPAAECSR
jgi:V/A-type H+/Na+-transporting ATPase subunit A